MGMDIFLLNERGGIIEEVGDPANYLHRLLPSHDDETYQCLRFIDWYGDTIFNRLQMERFLLELERIKGKARTPQEQELLGGIERLARRCTEESHRYLKFYGD
jgi:hypothetical protein